MNDATKQKISDTLKRKGIKPTQRFCERGDKHPSWKGGVTKDSHGYVMIKTFGHHRADGRNYVKRSVLVAEKKIGRKLTKEEIVHHINRIKDDDRPENLQVMTKREHIILHKPRLVRR